MKSNVGRLVAFLLLWWFSDLLTSLFGLFLLYQIGLSLYNVYVDNTSDGGGELTVDNDKDVVVISGCETGIGKAIADKLAQRFHVVATVLDTSSPGAIQLEQMGVEVVQMDLTDVDSIRTAIDEVGKILEGGRRLHGVVNNAGICIKGELDWLCQKQVDDVMKVNLTGPMTFTKLLLPRIISDKARLVNTTGLDGLTAGSGLAAYNSSKTGMEAFTDSLRMELGKYGVRVITVRPGDFSLLTCEAYKHTQYSTRMWEDMDQFKKQRYAADFDAYEKAILNTSGKLSAANFEGIRSTFERIMISEDPDDEYNEGNNLNIIVHRIISMLPKPYPEQLRNKILAGIMKIHLYRR
ncbi:retinol dehydrogenase 7 [Galendromus occidentalis]|uniref:Retinol dehydrogenase 7 n=1 Tax=Galendromus occidentalis TaxID=34638 RepID=A0AAJ6QN67_9ACAR|nr:retinol dehydrogenase 7 [Galendromus occidentalis]